MKTNSVFHLKQGGRGIKGFTLIELAIVLVVIGLLLGMAFKGKSLVDAAKWKADIMKISKIEAAFNTYYGKYNTLPGLNRTTKEMTPKAIYDDFIKEGLLRDSDFKMNVIGNTYFSFAGCNDAQNSKKEIVYDPVKLTSTNNVCLYRASAHPKTMTTSSPSTMQASHMNSFLICQIEVILDDKSISGGAGRQPLHSNNYNGDIITTHDFDCTKYENVKQETSSTNSSAYIYRVF